jgi:hypothetical protein
MRYRALPYAVIALGVLLAILGVFRNRSAVRPAEEQAVILKLRLVSGQMGSDEERQRNHDLEDRLENAIKRSAVGDFDGDEYGGGYCTLYMYGPSAEALFDAIQPALQNYHASSGSYALKRYGKPASPQVRIPLSSE